MDEDQKLAMDDRAGLWRDAGVALGFVRSDSKLYALPARLPANPR